MRSNKRCKAQLLQDHRPAHPTLIVSVRDNHHPAALVPPPPPLLLLPQPPPPPPPLVMAATVLRQSHFTRTGTMQTESTP